MEKEMKYLVLVTVLFSISLAEAFPSYAKQYGDLCDWRSPTEPCDQSRGLTCSYEAGVCSCWDARMQFSAKHARCVGRAGESCQTFETARLCTENAFCSDDRSLSPIPLCVCLKGYFRSDNGSCVRYSKYNEHCQPFPSRQACDSNLKCVDFSCRCEPGQIFDSGKEMCISKAGHRCHESLNNCIHNAECNEKMWAFDYQTGETKVIGFRCGCKPGLRVTGDLECAADFGGPCNKSGDCFTGENLICLNNVCQCNPLSQTYDKRARRCFNLVGTKCGVKNQTGLSDLKSGEEGSFSSGEAADCIPGSKCLPSGQGYNVCKCSSNYTTTEMRTCLLSYGQPCQSQVQEGSQLQEMKCNVFEGLVCHSDVGKCLCADPSLIYDKESGSCSADLGSSCGRMRLEMLNLDEDLKDKIVIKCISNSTCLEKNVNGMVKSICVPKGGFGAIGNSTASTGSSLSKVMFSNANAISDKE